MNAWNDLKGFLTSIIGTGTTVSAAFAATLMANLGLINQVLGALSIVAGIFTCLCLARVHQKQARLLDEQIQEITSGRKRFNNDSRKNLD